MARREDPRALVVGTGPTGCVCARRLAEELGWSVHVIDWENQVGGHCADGMHDSGLFHHYYGPHYFRTNEKWLVDYLSRFTDWQAGHYIVKVYHAGRYFPFPVNLDTLSMFFGQDLYNPVEARAFIDAKREPIDEPLNSEDFVLNRVGRELYEAFYLGYTRKQWDRHPRDLAPSVCGRVPVRFDCRNLYVNHTYPLLPKDGYTRMFESMLNHPKITLSLGVNFHEVPEPARDYDAVIYTGRVDDYFGRCYGPLEHRSLRFEFTVLDQELAQPCVQVNYPNDYDYTRTVEYKHITGQQASRTLVAYEYSQAEGRPYYPVPSPDQHERYERYARRAQDAEERDAVYLRGRLAEYMYVNMDEAMIRAFDTVDRIRGRFGNGP